MSDEVVANGVKPEDSAAGTAAAPGLTYVIDSSVAIKWYIPEHLSAEAKRFLEKDVRPPCHNSARRVRQRCFEESPTQRVDL